MGSYRPPPSFILTLTLLIIFLPSFTHAFGAGNIGSTSRIEGQNWRHGDIEDTLLTLLMSRAAGGKKFKDLDVKRVYFGNWLRDYSQAVDVGTVKSVSAEAIRIILWVLGFLSFGYGTKEFEVTRDRLGCYRPEEHIDNPKDYADNIDARQYDRRLRGPVDERRELSIDQRTGLKMYIASEDAGITTSAGLVRNLFGRAIMLGRKYARSNNDADWYEALRLLGTGCHCLEDFPAHSNYVELALRNCGEPDIFPHVGRATAINVGGVNHPIFPIITGTFGGVDFFHSVMGELSDKATQSEIQELEGSVSQSQRSANKSVVQELLSSLPSGLLGGKDQSGKADELESNATAHQMKGARISPRQPEAWTEYLNETIDGIRPILEFHDEIMQSITETVEKIPILPDLLDKLQDQINIFVFSLLAPYVLPVIGQVKAELATGSSEVIKSSQDKQLIVFHDDHSSDPTHSMLSKDHFSNVLNEPAGKTAAQILKWVVPQLIRCMDDESEDVDRTLTRIVNGVFHHPSMRQQGYDGAEEGRQLMFSVVEKWWHDKGQSEKQQLRRQLSREGVQSGRNHKEGVHDKGHGCCKPLGMPTMKTANSAGAIGGPSINTVLSGLGVGQPGGGAGRRPIQHGGMEHKFESAASQAVGGGILGSMVGGVVGSVLGGDDDDKRPGGQGGRRPSPRRQSPRRQSPRRQSPRRQSPRRESPRRDHSPGTSLNYSPPSYTQSSYAQQSYGRPPYGGGYGSSSFDPDLAYGYDSKAKNAEKKKKDQSDDDDDSEDDYAKQEKKARKEVEKERKKAGKKACKAQGYGSDDDDSDDSDDSRKAGHGRGDHHNQQQGYGRPSESYQSSYESPSYNTSSSSYQQSSYQTPSYGSSANIYQDRRRQDEGDRYGASTQGRYAENTMGRESSYSERYSGASAGYSAEGRSSIMGEVGLHHGANTMGQESSFSDRYSAGSGAYSGRTNIEDEGAMYGGRAGAGGGRTDYGQGRDEYGSGGGYGRQNQSSYGRDEPSYGSSGYGRFEESSVGGGNTYGRQQQESSYGSGGGDSYGMPGSFGGAQGGYRRDSNDEQEYGQQQRRYGGGGNDEYGGGSSYGGGYGGGYEERRY